MKKATIEDVALKAGVSTFTVSRALRDKEHVAPATKQRVIEAAKALNYTISRSATALASGCTRRIALLVCESIAAWFNGEIQEGIYDVLSQNKYDLLIYRASNETERRHFFDNLPADRNADALIVSFSLTDDEQHAVSSMGMPIVTINALNQDYCHGSVRIDDMQAEGDAIRYLSALGHAKFCFVDRPSHPWGQDNRIDGYRNTVFSLGLTDCGTFELTSDPDRPAKHATAQILALPQRPTAICGWSDDCAFAIVHELRRVGIRVPDDMSVIGFDAIPSYRLAGLTSVMQPAHDIGRIAAQKILDLLEGRQLETPHTIVPTQLIPGDTTGPAPQRDAN
ncbi:LacI family transcriptional regulator [Bifidobacterium lemurum]|uniref:LacI family transcriptional regulator n=1 Tax=Bifidobacterium lemurum TaxID=1603886 RepID=A0A261FQ54_9BIFI|nr:LacI family DNA-binding transcriptional regulator [Bifidobacterium lemurum]OZG60936.1 LacI family transcriptional regulator [Bifidobacterium lemurum]QOL34989.1 LacI family DNA-binding transcriptional regulator [Bifidobacterium lemurum]